MLMRSSVRGFTIIELLVVIAIISVLAGMLLPALAAAKESARSIDCVSNLKALALAVNLYAQNHDDYYPPAWQQGGTDSIAWCGAYYKVGSDKYMDVTRGPLWPYLQDKRVAKCKSFKATQVKYAGSGEISGYGINVQYVAGHPDSYLPPSNMGGWMMPAKTTEIANPSSTILFADCARVISGVINEELFLYARYKLRDGKPETPPVSNYATIHFRHDGHANAAFCDGHVDRVAPAELKSDGDGKCGWVDEATMDRQ